MPTPRKRSPSRSQGSPVPKRNVRSRRTQSVSSPTPSHCSIRLSSILQEKGINMSLLSPLARRSVLTDKTDIEEPQHISWWQRLDENSRDVIEFLESENVEANNIIEELDMEVLSQEKENNNINYSDMPDSSDNESIASIVLPQRKLFTEKEQQAQKKFGQLNSNRDTLAKANQTIKETINVQHKTLFQNKPRSKPIFPAALLNMTTADITLATADKTLTAVQPKPTVRNIFGNQQSKKRKNMFANFILAESDDEIPEIQPKVFGFKKSEVNKADNVSSFRQIDPSPKPNNTIDMELDDWRHLPSSTMVEGQLEAIMTDGQTPKKARLSKLSEAKETDVDSCNTSTNKTKTSNKSTSSKNKSISIVQENSRTKNNSMTTRNRSRLSEHNISGKFDLSNRNIGHNIVKTSISNKSKLSENIQPKTTINNKTIHETAEMDGQDLVKDNVHYIMGHEEPNENEDEEVGAQNPLNIKQRADEVQVDPASENNVNKSMNTSQTKLKQNKVNKSIIENLHQSINDNKNIEHEKQTSLLNLTGQRNVAESDNVIEESNKSCSKQIESRDINNENAENDSQKLQVEHRDIEGQSLEPIDNSDRQENVPVCESEKINENMDESQEVQNENVDENCSQGDIEETEKQNIEEDDDENYKNESQEGIQSGTDDQENVSVEIEETNESQEEIQSETEEQDNDSEAEISEANESQEVEDENEDDLEDENEVAVEKTNDSEVQSEHDDDSEEAIEETNESQEVIEDDDVENEMEATNDFQEEDRNEEIDASQDEAEQSEIDQDVEMDAEIGDQSEENFENIEPSNETPNVSHDTTGRNRVKNPTPELVMRDDIDHSGSFIRGRNTSIRKTKSLINRDIRPSMEPGNNTRSSERHSSLEGSGWDSHRTTRKTLRQTFGKDFTPRKSLRTLVMEKSARRQTLLNKDGGTSVQSPLANSTELRDETRNEVYRELTPRTKQATLQIYLDNLKLKNIEERKQSELRVKNFLNDPLRVINNPFKVPAVPKLPKKKPTQSNRKPTKTYIAPELLPEGFLDDLNYKPPKRYKPPNASWVTKRLYKHLETKLEPKYNYKARIRSEKLVETIFQFTKDIRRSNVADMRDIDRLKQEMARLDVVRTHFDFDQFFLDYMPRGVRIKVVPDIVNNLPLPRGGIYSDILQRDVNIIGRQ